MRALKAQGVDGIKLLGIDRDVMQAMEEEAHKEGLRVAHHVGVEETNAWDDIHFGTTSIEHWYGIPDAAIPDGVQGFPSYYNYNNETDRFRWAGHLWREADPERLVMVLDSMVARQVAWVPTLDIYEASRICSARARSPGSPTICIRRSRTTSGPIRRTTARTSSAGRRPTRRSGRRTTGSG